MKILKEKDTKLMYGGANISGALFQSLVRFIDPLYNVGRGLGSGIRRLFKGKLCECR